MSLLFCDMASVADGARRLRRLDNCDIIICSLMVSTCKSKHFILFEEKKLSLFHFVNLLSYKNAICRKLFLYMSRMCHTFLFCTEILYGVFSRCNFNRNVFHNFQTISFHSEAFYGIG